MVLSGFSNFGSSKNMSNVLIVVTNNLRFANIVLKSSDREKYEALDTDVPLNVIKAYLWWRLNTGKGRLNGNKITTQTLRKEFYQIARHNTRETDRTWSGKDFADMKEVKF